MYFVLFASSFFVFGCTARWRSMRPSLPLHEGRVVVVLLSSVGFLPCSFFVSFFLCAGQLAAPPRGTQAFWDRRIIEKKESRHKRMRLQRARPLIDHGQPFFFLSWPPKAERKDLADRVLFVWTAPPPCPLEPTRKKKTDSCPRATLGAPAATPHAPQNKINKIQF